MGGAVTELILASASPRRSELLGALRLPFRCGPAAVDETSTPQEAPEALCCRLSFEKAQAVSRDFPDATVIGADTIVVLDGTILGKPSSPADAVAMLRALRGRPHEVLSAVSVCQEGAPPRQHLERSRVWMRAYTEAEIRAYVATRDPLDKAGAYAIQHPGFHPVARWEGCYASIVGLPLAAIARLLAQAGWRSPVEVAEACHRATGVACCQLAEGVL